MAHVAHLIAEQDDHRNLYKTKTQEVPYSLQKLVVHGRVSTTRLGLGLTIFDLISELCFCFFAHKNKTQTTNINIPTPTPFRNRTMTHSTKTIAALSALALLLSRASAVDDHGAISNSNLRKNKNEGQDWAPSSTKCYFEGKQYNVGQEVYCWDCAYDYCTCLASGSWGNCRN